MDNTLNWEDLLNCNRFRDSSSSNGIRNAFECDYDRLVYSSSVRRLQDKAQVFPLQQNDFTRTRLTHSIEVSSIAASLGMRIGKTLEKRGNFKREHTEALEALLKTLGLAHDLGNPPFGHYGEEVIKQWFSKHLDDEIMKKVEDNLIKVPKYNLTENEKKDFKLFDGNVQNLRILMKLQMLNDYNGINFTYGTLCALIKYPWSATEAVNKGEEKYGYFISDKKEFDTIRTACGLTDIIRHPATFLLEAADDIVYLTDDIEDGVKKGVIQWEKEYHNLKETFKDSKNVHIKELFEKIDDELKRRPNDMPCETEAHVLLFRNYVQGLLIKTAEESFMGNYKEIMQGIYNGELIKEGEVSEFVKCIKKITSNNCFSCKEVIALELIGDKVITTLLDTYINALLDKDNHIYSEKYIRKLEDTISENYKYIAKLDSDKKMIDFKEISDYAKIQLVVDFISGMTDSYALNLYKELMGITNP